MWRDVLIANQGPILDALGSFAAHLRKARNRLIEENVEALGQQFSEARHVRNTIPRDTKGFLHPLADIYVFAEDRPGELLAIIQTLYDAGLNIKDIELLKIREGTGGAFRMSFTDDEEANTAVEALTDGEFIAYRL
jgi:prephenate dehydrogenase